MFGYGADSYAAGMETMKSLTSPLTPIAPSTPQSASYAKKCAGLTLKALKAVARSYMQGARYNAYWIGCPGAYVKTDRS
jgi:hypothetical protein